MELELMINEACDFILSKTDERPKIGLILGSGLGDYGDGIKNSTVIDYKDIPHFPVSTVEGHKGRFVINKDLICMQGRFHFYEGYKMTEVTFPIRVMKKLGIETVIITNACGGVNKEFKPGDLMVIKDHINFMGTNPLIGKNLTEFGVRFPDMTNCYTPEYIEMVLETGKKLGIDLKTGVYMGFSGPNYETPAEVRMAGIMGADAVGMSTVPEAIAACHSGINVIGISCVTNLAAGVSSTPLIHEEVIENSKKAAQNFTVLLNRVIENLI